MRYVLAALSLFLLTSTTFGQEEAPKEATSDEAEKEESNEETVKLDNRDASPQEDEAIAENPETADEENEVAGDEAPSADDPTSKEQEEPAEKEPDQDFEDLSTKESGSSPVEPAEPPAPTDVVEKTEEAAAAALTDQPEEKPSLLPLTVGTSTWSRFELRQNYDDLGVSRTRFTEGDAVFFRARLSLESAPLDLGHGISGSVKVTPQASGVWGTSGIGGTIGEANLGIYEGYFKFSGPRGEIKGGRFMMDYGDALIIGNLGWHQSARAFDGLHARYKMNHGYLDAFATQVASGWGVATDPPFLAGDTYFWGLYSGIGEYVAPNMALDLYFLGLSAAATEGLVDDDGNTYQRDGATLFTAGARAKQKLGIFDYRVEADLQFGETAGQPTGDAIAEAVSTFAYQADAEIGFSIMPRMRIGFGGLIASGNDDDPDNGIEAYNELFPTTHKWLGLMDVIGFRTNIASGFFKFNAGLTDTLGFMLNGHIFARPGEGGLGRASMADEGLAGYEFDTQLKQKIGQYGSVRGLYGLFIPNEDHYGSDSLAHYVAVQGGINF